MIIKPDGTKAWVIDLRVWELYQALIMINSFRTVAPDLREKLKEVMEGLEDRTSPDDSPCRVTIEDFGG